MESVGRFPSPGRSWWFGFGAFRFLGIVVVGRLVCVDAAYSVNGVALAWRGWNNSSEGVPCQTPVSCSSSGREVSGFG